MKKSNANVVKKGSKRAVVVVKAAAEIADAHVRAKRRHEAISKLREKGAKWAKAHEAAARKLNKGLKKASKPAAADYKYLKHIGGRASEDLQVVMAGGVVDKVITVRKQDKLRPTVFVTPDHIRKHLDTVCAFFAHIRDQERRALKDIGGFVTEQQQLEMAAFVANGAYKNRIQLKSFYNNAASAYKPAAIDKTKTAKVERKTKERKVVAPANNLLEAITREGATMTDIAAALNIVAPFYSKLNPKLNALISNGSIRRDGKLFKLVAA